MSFSNIARASRAASRIARAAARAGLCSTSGRTAASYTLGAGQASLSHGAARRHLHSATSRSTALHASRSAGAAAAAAAAGLRTVAASSLASSGGSLAAAAARARALARWQNLLAPATGPAHSRATSSLASAAAAARAARGPARPPLPLQPQRRASSSASSSSSSAAAGSRRKASTAAAAAAGGGSAATAAAAASMLHAPTGAAALTACLPNGTRRALATWLGVCSAWVASLVVLGGVTRLTRSGLSMTDWKFTGETPPSTEEEWAAEFARYRASPEYLRVNRGMVLDEFKFIYWMEWAHRMWGRALGLVFALPAAYFAVRGAVNAPLARRLALLFGMGGAQGLVGWWMVRSGLQEPQQSWDIPRVSPYRLAAHLMSAFTIYAGLLWTTLSVALPLPPAATAAAAAVGGAASLRRLALPVAGLIAVTAASGAFVAGLDAGHAYNTFPKMNGHWVPEEYWALPGWRNVFENTAAVQLHHRVLALATLGAVGGLWVAGSRLPLPRASALLLHCLLGVAAGQVTLGVATLLNYVPVTLGSAHQAGALTLFSVALGLLFSLRPFPHVSPFGAAASFLTPAAMASVVALGGTVANMA